MGRGLVEPTDDLRQTNPAVHPVLLNRLADDFVANRFDLRHTIRLIVSSESYQRGRDATNPMSERFFSQAQVRQLDPEVLADAIADVTGVSDRYGQLPFGTRAIALSNPATPSLTLDILGRCSREDSCETTTSVSGGLATKLHFINGHVINRKIAAESGRLNRLVQAGNSDLEIVAELFVVAFSRRPTEDELAFFRQQFRDAREEDHRRRQLEDFLWSLLASREFTTNH